MIRARALTSLGMVLAGAVLWHATAVPADKSASAAPPPHSGPFDQQSVWRTWKIYCDTCHFGPKARAGLNLEALDLANLGGNGAIWGKVLRKLRSREMPPAGGPPPAAAPHHPPVAARAAAHGRPAASQPHP